MKQQYKPLCSLLCYGHSERVYGNTIFPNFIGTSWTDNVLAKWAHPFAELSLSKSYSTKILDILLKTLLCRLCKNYLQHVGLIEFADPLCLSAPVWKSLI